jgi:hypothetical protein
MADDKEVTIRITGRNLTADEFEKARKGLAGIRTEAEKAKAPALSFRDALSGVTQIAGVFGVSLGLGAVVSFTRGVFDAASRIVDLAGALGISTEAAQRFKFAAEQGGATVEDVAKAINQMNRNLAEGDKGTLGALRAAGVSFEKVRAMKPEDAFLAITDAIEQIPDPMMRAEVATRLFGKSALALLPQMEEGFRKTSSAAKVMSDDTVRRLEAAEQTLENFGNTATIVAGEGLGKLGRAWQWFVEHTLPGVDAVKLAEQRLAAAQKEVAAATQTNTAAAHGMTLALAEQERRQQAAARAAEAHAKAIAQLRDDLSGAGAIKAARDMVEALRGLPPVQNLTRDAQNRINAAMERAIEVYRVAGRTAPEEIRKIYAATADLQKYAIPVIDGLSRSLVESLGPSFTMAYDSSVPLIGAVRDGLPQAIGQTMQVLPPLVGAVGGVRQSFLELNGTAGTAVGIFSEAFTGIRDVIHRYRDSSRNALDNVTSYWQGHQQATQGVLRVMQGDVRGWVDVVTGSLNQIMAGFSLVKGAINHFRGGEEGISVIPARDRFIAQFGPGGTGAGSGFQSLAGMLSEITGEGGGGQLFAALAHSDTMAEFNAAVAAIEETLRNAGRSFSRGTPGLDFADFGAGQTVRLHGQEAVIPRGEAGAFAAQVGAAIAAAMPSGNGSAPVVNVLVQLGPEQLRDAVVKIARTAMAQGRIPVPAGVVQRQVSFA